MKLCVFLSASLGLAMAIALVGYYGFAEIAGALGAGGWGVLAVIAFHGTQLLFSSLAWRSILPKTSNARLAIVIGLRWIREAVNNLLPVAQIGGELVGARLLSLRGTPLSVAGASVTVDLTMEMASQIVFTLLGLALVIPGLHDATTARWALAGFAAAAGFVLVSILLQLLGLFRIIEWMLVSVAQKMGWSSLGDVAGLDQAIRSIYDAPGRLGLACGSHLISWLLGGVEVMLALHLLGVGVDLREGLIVESVGQALRCVGFAVPASLGIQEGGYALICGLLGISPQAAIELSLLKRIREVALGIPALIVWQSIEGRNLMVQAAGKAPLPATANADLMS